MTHDETKWAIKFSGGEVLQAQSAQRFAIFYFMKKVESEHTELNQISLKLKVQCGQTPKIEIIRI